MTEASENLFVVAPEFWVRFAETDAGTIVHHSSYVLWMEEARQEYGRAIGADYATAQYALNVVDMHIRYLLPSRFGDRIVVRCWIEELKSRTVNFAYEIKEARRGDLFATGETKHICVNLEGQVTRIPDLWRSKIVVPNPSN